MEKGISVIIPTFNRERHIEEAIQSILRQECSDNIEIIISDDGSTDNTLTVASRFGEKVKILEKPAGCSSQGASGARNRGIEAATQPYISFLDSDDFYLPGHLKKIRNILENNPQLGFAFCRILECEEANGKRMYRPWTHSKVFKEDIENPVVSRSHIVHTNSFLFRKEVLEKVGFFNESYSNGEDGDLWMRISELYKGSFSDHYGAIYKTSHGDSQLTKNKEEEIRNNYLKIFNAAIKRYYQLRLHDSYRIFKLKHIILNLLFKNRKDIYYVKYIRLILNYPIAPIYIIKEYFYNYKKSKNNKFYEIDKYCSLN